MPADRVATEVDKGHGRLEKRTLRTTSILTLHQLWPGLAQGFEITRERTEKGQTTVEVVYGISSLKPEKAQARRLSEIVRSHWLIENRLHYVRDVTLHEDACRVRKGTAPQVLAALRNTIVHLLGQQVTDSLTHESRPAVIRRLAAQPNQALALLGLPPLPPQETTEATAASTGHTQQRKKQNQVDATSTKRRTETHPPPLL